MHLEGICWLYEALKGDAERIKEGFGQPGSGVNGYRIEQDRDGIRCVPKENRHAKK